MGHKTKIHGEPDDTCKHPCQCPHHEMGKLKKRIDELERWNRCDPTHQCKRLDEIESFVRSMAFKRLIVDPDIVPGQSLSEAAIKATDDMLKAMQRIFELPKKKSGLTFEEALQYMRKGRICRTSSSDFDFKIDGALFFCRDRKQGYSKQWFYNEPTSTIIIKGKWEVLE